MKKFYYTIGEVANLLEVKQHVLRYWEKEFPPLNPKKKQGRNRRYNPDDIVLLKKIKYMLYTQKYTIEGVRKKLKELQRSKQQIELDFVVDKNDAKQDIIRELKSLKELLSE